MGEGFVHSLGTVYLFIKQQDNSKNFQLLQIFMLKCGLAIHVLLSNALAVWLQIQTMSYTGLITFQQILIVKW